MQASYFSYPWRVSFPDLAEGNADALPVASGACFIHDGDVNYNSSLPVRIVQVGKSKIKIYEVPDTDEHSVKAASGQSVDRICASIGAYGGLRVEQGEDASELNEMIEEALRYIQRIEEIIEGQKKKPTIAHPCVPWSILIDELKLTNWQGDLARKPLIVQLAEQQGFPLKEIGRGAKRILRRVRDKERVSRAREFDKATLIRIAQLPGHTLAQKAGPRQRIPAVKRYETTDTLENRVVEHFCRLAEGEWQRTETGERIRVRGEQREVAEAFERMCRRVRTSDDFSLITKLRAPCTAPNFTLEQNMNYRSIWTGYKRLIQRQTEQEECWAWVRRVFLNRALVFAAELFDQAFPIEDSVHLPFSKHLRARLSHNHGLWVEPDSLPGPRVFRREQKRDYSTAYILSPHDIQDGPSELHGIGMLNADGYYLVVSGEGVRVSPFYCFVGGRSRGALKLAHEDLKQVNRQFSNRSSSDGMDRIKYCDPVFIWADFLRPEGEIPEIEDGILAGNIPVINDTWHSPSITLSAELNRVLSP